jgi:peptidylprolyl isomerase
MMSKFTNISLCILTALALVFTSCDNSTPKAKQPADEVKQPTNGQIISQENTPSTNNLDVDIKKISEALGNFIGRNLDTPGVHFDLESIIKGIRDGASGKPSPLNDQEYEKAMSQLQQQALNAMSNKNLEAANAFMQENAKAKGIVEVIPGKLQYLILEEGHGDAVKEHSNPQITYVGKYIDGTVFGDSSTSGGPITVPLDQTIPGFSKGILGMKEGEKRRLFVHPEVGYGTTGQLLPNSLLIFDIQVIKASAPEGDEKETAEAFHGNSIDIYNSGNLGENDQDNPQ